MFGVANTIDALFDRAKNDGVELYVNQNIEEDTYTFVMKKDGFCITDRISAIEICDAFISPVKILNYRYDRCLEKLQEAINKSQGE